MSWATVDKYLTHFYEAHSARPGAARMRHSKEAREYFGRMTEHERRLAIEYQRGDITEKQLRERLSRDPSRSRDAVERFRRLPAPVKEYLHLHASHEPRRVLDEAWRELTPAQRRAVEKELSR